MNPSDFAPFAGDGPETNQDMWDIIPTDPREFMKAITAAGGSDPATLTGGAATRLQSIEPFLLKAVQSNRHLAAWNKIPKSNAFATWDEFTTMTNVGDFPGGSFNDELGIIAETQGQYDRKVLQIKFLMQRRSVSVVAASQRTQVPLIAQEKLNGTLALLTDAEYATFYGNSAVVPQEFDGIETLIRATGDTDLIVDVRAQSLTYVAQEIINLAQAIAGQDRWGIATDLFMSYKAQQDFDQKLDPTLRTPITGINGGGTQLGTPVSGLRTSWGDIAFDKDSYILEGGCPWEARTLGNFASVVTQAGLTPPIIASATPATGTAANLFGAAQAGLFYYGVESVGKLGRSTAVVSAQVNVGQGQKVTITITNPADTGVTGYAIHRGARGGTNAKANLREMIRIPRTAGASTVFVDENADIPGTSKLFCLNLDPAHKALTYRRLLPLTMFKLYPTQTAANLWAQLLFIGLRMGLPHQHGMVKNYLPAGSTFQPF